MGNIKCTAERIKYSDDMVDFTKYMNKEGYIVLSRFYHNDYEYKWPYQYRKASYVNGVDTSKTEFDFNTCSIVINVNVNHTYIALDDEGNTCINVCSKEQLNDYVYDAALAYWYNKNSKKQRKFTYPDLEDFVETYFLAYSHAVYGNFPYYKLFASDLINYICEKLNKTPIEVQLMKLAKNV